MRTRAELQHELAEAQAKLEALPPAHHYPNPAVCAARTAALQARIKGLQDAISTTPVDIGLPPVEDDRPAVDNPGARNARVIPDPSPSTARAQDDPQDYMPPDLR